MKIWIEIDESKLEDVKEVLEGKKEAKKNLKEESGKKQQETNEKGDTENTYDNMSSKDLYKLCCERGISSKCKKRDKASLIAVLKENDAAEQDAEDDSEEWGDDSEEQSDPYEGKTAKELYKMCCDRGLSVKPKQKPEAYVKALKESDSESDDEDSDDDWEID